LKRRDFIQKLVFCGAALGLFGKLSGPRLAGLFAKDKAHFEYVENPPAAPADYYRIVVLGDPHLPVREREVKDLGRRQKIIEAKRKVAEDINAWDDVHQINVLGDIVAQFGNEEEYAYAAEYFARFKKPVYLIAGNHDYIYTDSFSAQGKFVLGGAASRKQKLSRFKKTFGELFYSQSVGQYLLVYLSPDALETPHLAQMSDEQLDWFRSEVAKNPTAPTIVFFHAPLAGTLLNYNRLVNTPDFIAMPEQAIAEILRDNPQIILWVSGHTHTPATNPSYASPVNTFAGHVLNIHNADMDRETIWTNSLYLYPDKVVVKTFNHREQIWQKELERTVYLPNAGMLPLRRLSTGF